MYTPQPSYPYTTPPYTVAPNGTPVYQAYPPAPTQFPPQIIPQQGPFQQTNVYANQPQNYPGYTVYDNKQTPPTPYVATQYPPSFPPPPPASYPNPQFPPSNFGASPLPQQYTPPSEMTTPLPNATQQLQAVNISPASKFVCYVVPFPPLKRPIKADAFVPCFMVYTAPAPPMAAPVPGEKEGRVVQSKRKWEKAKADAKAKGGIKGKAILALDNSMAATKNSRVEFLSRCPKEITEFELNYPPSIDPAIIQQTFMKMLEVTRKGAQKNMLISTLLLPVTFVADLFFIFWPLPGPFFPVDAVWAFANYQALNSTSTILKANAEGHMQVTYKPNPALLTVSQQLESFCLAQDSKAKVFMCNPATGPVTDDYALAAAVGFHEQSDRTAVLDTKTGLMTQSPQWSPAEISEDLRKQLKKGAKEYYKAVKKSR